MNTLIVNGINWLDPRMIGLKCFFRTYESSPEWVGELSAVMQSEDTKFCDVEGCFSNYCRLAQGEKTHYDGKGQPVPDGVLLNIWHGEHGSFDDQVLAEECYWKLGTTLTHYQAQEQKLEVEQDKCKGKNCTSMDGKNHSPECMAEYDRAVGVKPVPIELLERIKAALGDALDTTRFAWSNSTDEFTSDSCEDRLAELKSILKELE